MREKAGGFLDLVFSPELAAEVTLQPVRRFGFDAAILFSDILVVPHALGQKVRFAVGEGPQLDPIADRRGFERLASEIDHDGAGAGLRDDPPGQARAQAGCRAARLLRRALDGRELHDCRPRHARPGAGAAVRLSRCGGARRVVRRAGGSFCELSGAPARGRRRCGADFRHLGRRAAAARNSPNGASSRRSGSLRRCAARCRAQRSSDFRAAPARCWRAMSRRFRSMRSGSTG